MNLIVQKSILIPLYSTFLLNHQEHLQQEFYMLFVPSKKLISQLVNECTSHLHHIKFYFSVGFTLLLQSMTIMDHSDFKVWIVSKVLNHQYISVIIFYMMFSNRSNNFESMYIVPYIWRFYQVKPFLTLQSQHIIFYIPLKIIVLFNN